MRRVRTFCSLCVLLALMIVGVSTFGQTFKVLHRFGKKPVDGMNPTYPGIIAQGRDGNLYGTTPEGSGNGGTVFKVTTAGRAKVLYEFQDPYVHPLGGLTLATDGNLYGALDGYPDNGTATAVYKVTESGKVQVVSELDTEGLWEAQASPIQGWDGPLYGNTLGGGDDGQGGVYKLTLSGKLTVLYSFSYPFFQYEQGPLMQGPGGDLYGTAEGGGTYGYGAVFKITRKGEPFLLYSFDLTHGAYPYAPLVEGVDGDFYGTTAGGGLHGFGTVFNVTPQGQLTVLHSFRLQENSEPYGGLVLASDGNFYGTSSAYFIGNGIIFRISPEGDYKVVHYFNGLDGAVPEVTLTQHTNGILYGDTLGGGYNGCDLYEVEGCGVFYSLDLGLPPFAGLNPRAGRVGKKTGILGQGFTGATAVSFNGTAASYSVESDTFLEAVVPSGATSGLVTVTSPSGTLTSKQQFIVLP